MSEITDAEDRIRATVQREQVWNLMRGGGWWTIHELQAAGVSGAETGISARIRDMRKKQYGGHVVECRRRSGGTYEYRLQTKKQMEIW